MVGAGSWVEAGSWMAVGSSWVGAEGGGSAEVVAMAKVSYNTFAQVIHVLYS